MKLKRREGRAKGERVAFAVSEFSFSWAVPLSKLVWRQ